MILLIFIMVIFADIPKYFSDVPRLANTEAGLGGSLGGRLFKHQIAIRIIKQNPILGAFPGNYSEFALSVLSLGTGPVITPSS